MMATKQSFYHHGYSARMQGKKLVIPSALKGIYRAQFARGYNTADKLIKNGVPHDHYELNPVVKRAPIKKINVKKKVSVKNMRKKIAQKKPIATKPKIRKTGPIGVRVWQKPTPEEEASLGQFIWDELNKRGKVSLELLDQLIRQHDRQYRANNPVPPSRNVKVQKATKLYEDFTGHDGEVIEVLEKPEMPDVMLAVGEIDGIMYSTVRDGKLEKYIHEFKKKARPLFCVSHDGTSIHLLGGAYDFTERGIVDKRT